MVVVVAVGRDAEFPGRLIWPWKSSFPLWKWSRASIQGPHLRLPPPSLYARGGRREEASYLFSRRILSSCWSPLHNKKILFFLFNYRTASWIHFHLFIFYRSSLSFFILSFHTTTKFYGDMKRVKFHAPFTGVLLCDFRLTCVEVSFTKSPWTGHNLDSVTQKRCCRHLDVLRVWVGRRLLLKSEAI